jgi:hypothetical protein
LHVQDWFAGEEAAGCLLVVFGEGREVVHAGSGGDSGERHVWRFEGGVVVVGWDGECSMAARIASTAAAVCCEEPRLDLDFADM